MEQVRRCKRCIMDNSADPYITFDKNGYCNYCTSALERKEKVYFPTGNEGEKRLHTLLDKLRAEGKDKKYDCLMGLSGGLDSSYLAYLGTQRWHLRIAAVHVDDGYDTEISQRNIKNLCEKASIDLITIRPDAKQYNALTRAYMEAGVPNLAVPQDNILFAYLYKFAKQNKIKYFLSGSNFALECILQKGNTWSAYDMTNLRDIQRRFGKSPIDKLEFISSIQRQLDERFLGLKTVAPLNLVEYNRDKAFAELKAFCGFEYYGRKHLENYLTAFVQLCWFPEKFHVDKRTSHLSSMIVSDQMTREEALREYEQPLYEKEYMEKVKTLICENMGLSRQELEGLIHAPGKQHTEYRTEKLIPLMRKIKHLVK